MHSERRLMHDDKCLSQHVGHLQKKGQSVESTSAGESFEGESRVITSSEELPRMLQTNQPVLRD